MMVPYELDVAVWYYCRAEDHPSMERDAPMWRQTVERFLAEGLLVTPGSHDMVYGPTDRLRAFVEALEQTPLPVQKWIMPVMGSG